MKFVFTYFILFLALSINAQQSLAGLWNSGKYNTVIEVLQEDGKWVGQIRSSDNADAVIGKTILKDLGKQGDKWKGKIFIAKRQKWANVQITPQASQLDLVVSAGFSQKNIQWLRAEE